MQILGTDVQKTLRVPLVVVQCRDCWKICSLPSPFSTVWNKYLLFSKIERLSYIKKLKYCTT